MLNLKDLRKERGIKQSFVAHHLGTWQHTMSEYENGKRKLPPRFIRPLSQLYGVSVDVILSAAYPEGEGEQ